MEMVLNGRKINEPDRAENRGRVRSASRAIIAPALLATVVLAACRATAPGTPATGPHSVSPTGTNQPSDSTAAIRNRVPDYTRADVRFMQGMIIHHAQALAMTALVPERAGSEGIRLLARRIEISQRSEIEMMRDWLRERGQEVPEADTTPDLGPANGPSMEAGEEHAAERGHLMPGMLTREQMTRLAHADGKEFDRLFLELMIQHHKGALTMVGNLFAAGAAQEPETYNFVAHVDSGQRMEIRRMRAMLEQRTDDRRGRRPPAR